MILDDLISGPLTQTLFHNKVTFPFSGGWDGDMILGGPLYGVTRADICQAFITCCAVTDSRGHIAWLSVPSASDF